MAVLIAGGFMASTCAWGQANYATPYTFVTIAGTAGNNSSANGLNGAGLFEFPEGMVVDTNDNLYVVDSGASTVVKVSPAGGTNWMVTRIAGNPDNPGSHDGNNQSATFSEPAGIAIDSSNNLYVADTGNSILRKMTQSGPNWAVTTIAGTPEVFGSADGTNGAAQFEAPAGIAVDASGNLYVADTDNQTIRMVVPMGTNWVVTTIAGTVGSQGATDGTNLTAQFFNPSAIVVDHAGNLFVADSGNNTIREMVPVGTNWVVSTIAGSTIGSGNADGTNTSAQFNFPAGLAVDANDNLYVADTFNNSIRKITPVGTNWVTTTLAGAADNSHGTNNGTGTNAFFYNPYGVTADVAGKLFVGDTINDTIRQGTVAAVPNPAISLTAGGSVMVSWPGPGGTLQTNADLSTANWGVYGGTVSSSGGTNSVTLPPTGGSLYFRLTN